MTVGQPLTPKRKTTWWSADYKPVAQCQGFEPEGGEPITCDWGDGGAYGLEGTALKAAATRHVVATGHFVLIDRVSRTTIASTDERDPK